MRHDMTPVARSITDAEKNRLVFGLRFLQRFRAPGIPIDWVVRVLQEIWARFVY